MLTLPSASQGAGSWLLVLRVTRTYRLVHTYTGIAAYVRFCLDFFVIYNSVGREDDCLLNKNVGSGTVLN